VAGARNAGRARVLVGFAAFGLFWGGWGAALPAVRVHANASEGALGAALLCIGAGALLSMRPTGVLIDRAGPRVAPLAFAAFGLAAALAALAPSPGALAAALLALGAASGAADVAINADGTGAERIGRPLLTLAHALFSGSVVAASLLVAVARAAGAGAEVIVGALAVLELGAAVALWRLEAPTLTGAGAPRGSLLRIPAPLLVLGALTALAYLVENAWQSWSAIHLESTLGAPPGLASLAPAVFGAAATAGRVAGHRAGSRVSPRALVVAGAATATAGSLVAALAGAPGAALAGIAAAGVGTSICAPTFISLAGRLAGPAERGAAVSAVTTLAYLGFLVGPAAVGAVADLAGLTAALAGVAGVAAVLAVLTALAGPLRAPRAAGVI
jgi:Major Facilitator Superfamily